MISEIYRVPNTNETQSIMYYENMITTLCHTKADILTDQNFDLMKTDTNTNVSDLLNVFFTAGVIPVIKQPTRITHTSSTLIDNLFVKYEKYENIDSPILLSDISDHFPIITCMGNKTSPTRIKQLTGALGTLSWDEIFSSDQVEECYDDFVKYLNNIVNSCAPENTTIRHRSIIREPWMTPELIKSSNKRMQLYRKALGKERLSESFSRKMSYRNE